MTGQLSVLSTAKTFEIKLKLSRTSSWARYLRSIVNLGVCKQLTRGIVQEGGRRGEGRVNWKVQSSDASEKTMLVVKSSCHGRFFISANFTFFMPTKNSVNVVWILKKRGSILTFWIFVLLAPKWKFEWFKYFATGGHKIAQILMVDKDTPKILQILCRLVATLWNSSKCSVLSN